MIEFDDYKMTDGTHRIVGIGNAPEQLKLSLYSGVNVKNSDSNLPFSQPWEEFAVKTIDEISKHDVELDETLKTWSAEMTLVADSRININKQHYSEVEGVLEWCGKGPKPSKITDGFKVNGPDGHEFVLTSVLATGNNWCAKFRKIIQPQPFSAPSTHFVTGQFKFAGGPSAPKRIWCEPYKHILDTGRWNTGEDNSPFGTEYYRADIVKERMYQILYYIKSGDVDEARKIANKDIHDD